MKNKILPILSVFILLTAPALSFAQLLPEFTPEKLVDDKVFTDTATFGGSAGIQKFLESKGSVLANTSPEFLAKLKEPSITMLKAGLDDPQPALDRLRSAAELIWDSSRAAGINPQVILVTLQKEQGLITNHQTSSPEVLQKALDRAMGFDCPDATGCGNLFPGFYYQLFGNFDASTNRYLGAPKSLMKSFNTPGGRGPVVDGRVAKVGETITIENTQGPPNNCPASQQVTLVNSATAALYRYTPHVCNGNYNFWKFFNAWFRYPNGTLVQINGDVKTYIIQNGTRQLVPAFVAQARGLNLSSAIIVSPTELESYPVDKVYGPVDNTVVKTQEDGKFFVFINNIKHPASPFVIGQRGLNTLNALTVTTAEVGVFEAGSILTPSEGTVLKGHSTAGIYLVENGNLRLFSPFTFAQRKAQKLVKVIPEEEVATYPKQGYVAPLDGTLFKAPDNLTVYYMEGGFKHPVTAELFRNRNFSFKNVVVLSSEEVTGITIGAFVTPADKTFFKVSQTGQLYIFKEGSKHPISGFVAKQRRITPDYTFDQGVAYEWLDGIAIPPRDGTLVRGDKDLTVYVVINGQLRGLTGQAFKNRRFSLKSVKVLPQGEVEAYAKGEVIVK